MIPSLVVRTMCLPFEVGGVLTHVHDGDSRDGETQIVVAS